MENNKFFMPRPPMELRKKMEEEKPQTAVVNEPEKEELKEFSNEPAELKEIESVGEVENVEEKRVLPRRRVEFEKSNVEEKRELQSGAEQTQFVSETVEKSNVGEDVGAADGSQKRRKKINWNGAVNWFGFVASLGLVALFVYLIVL